MNSNNSKSQGEFRSLEVFRQLNNDLTNAVKIKNISEIKSILSRCIWQERWDLLHCDIPETIALQEGVEILRIFLTTLEDSEYLKEFEARCMKQCIKYCDIDKIKLLRRRKVEIEWDYIFNTQEDIEQLQFKKQLYSKILKKRKKAVLRYFHDHDIPEEWPCRKDSADSFTLEFDQNPRQRKHRKFEKLRSNPSRNIDEPPVHRYSEKRQRLCEWCQKDKVLQTKRLWDIDIERDQNYIGWPPEEVMLDIYEMVKL
jgi:hypothetical protein